MKQYALHKAARIALLVLLRQQPRGVGRPKKQPLDTRRLAGLMGVTMRSIQRDIHDVIRVEAILEDLRKEVKRGDTLESLGSGPGAG